MVVIGQGIHLETLQRDRIIRTYSISSIILLFKALLPQTNINIKRFTKAKPRPRHCQGPHTTLPTTWLRWPWALEGRAASSDKTPSSQQWAARQTHYRHRHRLPNCSSAISLRPSTNPNSSRSRLQAATTRRWEGQRHHLARCCHRATRGSERATIGSSGLLAVVAVD